MKEIELQEYLVKELRKFNYVVISITNELSFRRKDLRDREIFLFGAPDLIVFSNYPKLFFIELKRNKYCKQSEEQKRFEELIKSLGYQYILLSGIEEINNFLEKIKNKEI